MNVGQLLAAASAISRSRYTEPHKKWIAASFRVGALLPNSLAIMSVQRAGELDLILTCLEDDFIPQKENATDLDLLEFNTQMMLSELWVGSIYEIVRLIKDRQDSPTLDLVSLYHDLTLVRVPLEKHEIANERKLKEPLLFKKQPANNDSSDYYSYSQADPKRGHIMPHGLSARGSAMWQTINIVTKEEPWIERRALSERFLALWDTK